MDLICRTCLAYEDELQPIFSKKLVDTDYKEISTMVLLCTGLEVSVDDELPNTICNQCIESIIAAFKYRKKVWESNNVLLETTKVLCEEVGTKLNFWKMNPKTEYFEVEKLDSDVSDIDEHNYTEFSLRENNYTTVIEIVSLASEPNQSYKNMNKYLREAKFTTIQSKKLIQNDFSKLSYIEIDPIAAEDYLEATMNNYFELDDKSSTIEPYETSEPDSPISDHSDIEDVQNCIELEPNDKTSNDKVVTTPTTNNQNMDRVTDNSSTTRAYETTKTESPLSNHSDSADETNYIELGPNDKLSIKKLASGTTSKLGCYKNIDKYIRVAEESNTIRPYSCTFCNQTYEIIGPLRKHIIKNHDIRVAQAFRCIICSKTFINKLYFKRHLTEAHRPENINQKNYVCDLCGRSFKYRSAMFEHIDRHKGIKKYKCEICEFGTCRPSDLKIHMRTHTGEKPYVCNICGLSYKTSSRRSAHVTESHSGGLTFECTICSKTFKSRRVYKSHMQVHNPSRHVKCDVCNKEFVYRKNLKIHMRQHGEKNFKCTLCDKAFYQKQNCQSHMKKAHNVKM